jgi:antitoxin VapB
MALHIRHPEAGRLARRLADTTGKSLTEVVIEALRDRLNREERRTVFPWLKEEIMAISRRAAALPRRTGRSADEIIGYDERGLPR